MPSSRPVQESPRDVQPWAEPLERILARLGADPATGLSEEEAQGRIAAHGENTIRSQPRRPAGDILLDQVKSLIILLLAVAAGLSLSFGQWLEGVSIVLVILLNVAIGFVTELKATRSMEALARLSRVKAKAVRGGSLAELPSERLVPGDLVVVEGGDMVPADLRLIEGNRLRADESALTGESVPVDKDEPPVAPDAPLAERSSMLWKGTALTGGSGRGVVTATEIGRAHV